MPVFESEAIYGAATPPKRANIDPSPVPTDRTDVGYNSAT